MIEKNKIKNDLRRNSRIKAKFPIQYQRRRGGFAVEALTEDLSLSGVRLKGDRVLTSGLNLSLELNILSKIIKPLGKVIWSKTQSAPGEYSMGVEFIEINPQDKDCLSDYINMRINEFNEKLEN